MSVSMKSIEDRYLNDPVFHNLVKTMESAIEKLELTPSEIRAAAMLAALRVEARNPIARPILRELEERMESDAKLSKLIQRGLL